MNKKGQWKLFVGVGIALVIVVALVSAGFLDNFFNSPPSKGKPYYTKAEVDALIKSISTRATYQGVAEMFGDAKTTGQIILGVSQRVDGPIRITNGHTECGPAQACLLGYGGVVFPETQYFNHDNSGIVSCDQTLNLDEIQASGDWINGSQVIVQYLCISKELLQFADAGFPK